MTVTELINNIDHSRRKDNAERLLKIIGEELNLKAKVWDEKVVGFGEYHYVNKTNEGDMPIIGFVPAKAHITVYFTVQGLDPYTDLLAELGSFRRGKICLYINNLDKINEDVLRTLIRNYYQDIKTGEQKYS